MAHCRFERSPRSDAQLPAAHCAVDAVLPTGRARSSGPYRWTTAAAHPAAETWRSRLDLENLRSRTPLRWPFPLGDFVSRQVFAS
jgi:hypothetical protein